jgi:predicted HicB family RNase H-like nuclease
VRVPPELKRAIVAEAAARGVDVSVVVREVLEPRFAVRV